MLDPPRTVPFVNSGDDDTAGTTDSPVMSFTFRVAAISGTAEVGVAGRVGTGVGVVEVVETVEVMGGVTKLEVALALAPTAASFDAWATGPPSRGTV
jgi:hypothetical protein